MPWGSGSGLSAGVGVVSGSDATRGVGDWVEEPAGTVRPDGRTDAGSTTGFPSVAPPFAEGLLPESSKGISETVSVSAETMTAATRIAVRPMRGRDSPMVRPVLMPASERPAEQTGIGRAAAPFQVGEAAPADDAAGERGGQPADPAVQPQAGGGLGALHAGREVPGEVLGDLGALRAGDRVEQPGETAAVGAHRGVEQVALAAVPEQDAYLGEFLGGVHRVEAEPAGHLAQRQRLHLGQPEQGGVRLPACRAGRAARAGGAAAAPRTGRPCPS